MKWAARRLQKNVPRNGAQYVSATAASICEPG
jgi:hypothetical protein